MKKHQVKLFAALALSTMILAGCASQTPTTPTTPSGTSAPTASVIKDEVVIGISAEPATLDPHIQSGQATRLIKQNIYRGLMSYQPDNSKAMELAEKIELQADGITYKVTLKDGLKFHDGSKVTSADVKYSIDRILNPVSKATFGADFRLVVDKVEIVDDKVSNIVLKKPSTPFLDMLALPETVIVSKTWFENTANDPAIKAMGNGPYVFESWDKGREIKVTAFADFYKKGKPESKALRFVFYTDNATRANALRSGDVDIIDYVPSNEVIAFESAKDAVVDISVAPIMLLQFNVKTGPLADPKVRKAIAYAIDREGVISAAFMGRGIPIYGFPTLKGQNGYDGKYDNFFTEDLTKAKALLAEAGYANGFKIKILATSTYEMHKQTALVVQASLKQIGIDAEVELPDWATRISRSNVGDYDILVSGTTGNILDMDWVTNYFASGEPRMNSSAWFADAEIDKLLEEGRTTVDEAERAVIYDKFRLRALELSPFVFINYREQVFAMSDKVKGFQNMDGILTYTSGITLENTTVTK